MGPIRPLCQPCAALHQPRRQHRWNDERRTDGENARRVTVLSPTGLDADPSHQALVFPPSVPLSQSAHIFIDLSNDIALERLRRGDREAGPGYSKHADGATLQTVLSRASYIQNLNPRRYQYFQSSAQSEATLCLGPAVCLLASGP